jgi:hypothetical protein
VRLERKSRISIELAVALFGAYLWLDTPGGSSWGMAVLFGLVLGVHYASPILKYVDFRAVEVVLVAGIVVCLVQVSGLGRMAIAAAAVLSLSFFARPHPKVEQVQDQGFIAPRAVKLAPGGLSDDPEVLAAQLRDFHRTERVVQKFETGPVADILRRATYFWWVVPVGLSLISSPFFLASVSLFAPHKQFRPMAFGTVCYSLSITVLMLVSRNSDWFSTYEHLFWLGPASAALSLGWSSLKTRRKSRVRLPTAKNPAEH